MADQRDGGIAWTEQTWNPIRGCSRVSEGCRHCYAETVAARFSGPGQPYHGLAMATPSGPRWTGEVELVEKHLADPLRWKRPRMVFVNSMSDLFHERLTNEQIAAVFGVMAAAKQHTFQVLTKRAKRMREWFAWIAKGPNDPVSECVFRANDLCGASLFPRNVRVYPEDMPKALADTDAPWPLPNVWLGVSVEDQPRADERIPELLACPAAVRWVSYEPALGPVDFMRISNALGTATHIDALNGRWGRPGAWQEPYGARLDWIVVGGESGPGARPFDLAWARSVIAQGRAVGVPVFVKQMGANTPGWSSLARDRKGADLAEWPEDLRVREFPRAASEAAHA